MSNDQGCDTVVTCPGNNATARGMARAVTSNTMEGRGETLPWLATTSNGAATRVAVPRCQQWSDRIVFGVRLHMPQNRTHVRTRRVIFGP